MTSEHSLIARIDYCHNWCVLFQGPNVVCEGARFGWPYPECNMVGSHRSKFMDRPAPSDKMGCINFVFGDKNCENCKRKVGGRKSRYCPRKKSKSKLFDKRLKKRGRTIKDVILFEKWERGKHGKDRV